MSEINYISRHLLSKIKDIDFKLSSKSKEIISRKTSQITKHLIKFDSIILKKYEDLKLDKNYFIKDRQDINLDANKVISFENTPEILGRLNKKINLELILDITDGFEEIYKIKIEIYHNRKDDEEILLRNINKLMTRLWNLFKLFIKKNEDSVNYTFKMYLYSKPKTANNNYNGKNYLNNLNDIKCFNTYNGLTQEHTSEISRLEESISLLTHEFFHVVNLNNADSFGFRTDRDGGEKFWQGEFYLNAGSMEINEIFINSFTTIYHSYLISKEIQNESNDFKLENIVRNEIIYSIVLSIRLSKISNISIKDIYNRNKLINDDIDFGE